MKRWWMAVAVVVAGCFGAHRLYVVDRAPPQPQYEQAAYRPGYVWVKGAWVSDGSEWQWQPGHYDEERPGQVWRDGYWEPSENRWHWVEGHWETGEANPHDHRTPEPGQQPYQPPPGSIIVPSAPVPH